MGKPNLTATLRASPTRRTDLKSTTKSNAPHFKVSTIRRKHFKYLLDFEPISPISLSFGDKDYNKVTKDYINLQLVGLVGRPRDFLFVEEWLKLDSAEWS